VRRRLAASLLALLAGCGGGGSVSAPELSPAAVPQAPARVRAERTFAFEASYVRQVPGKPGEQYLTMEGAVDVGRGVGRLEADFSGLLVGGPGTSTPLFEQPIELSWTRDELIGVLDGEKRSLPRARARESGGLIGRLPDEPAALVEVLGRAEAVRRVGEEEVDEQPVVRFSCSVDARRAGEAGVPAELAPAFEKALYGPNLPLEVWLDADGLPRRIEYVIRLKPLRSGGKQILPARVVRGRYDLTDFGEPIATSS
jgi:hypothetical protein